jgi:response regulator RpfG family c-di-GMP phosphodiesterase
MNETDASKPRVICVDDQEGVVAGMRLTLRKQFEVLVATSGEQALKILSETENVAVFITDMCMPGMSGAELLERAAEIAPHTAKIVLSGQSDLESAIRAVNAGQIFRYLKKPCAPPDLRQVCVLAAALYERGLLERNLARETLTAMTDLLCESLMLSTPLAFGRVGRIRMICMRLAAHLGVGLIEDVGLAAGLASLGLLSVPGELMEAKFHGRRINEMDRQILDMVPETSALMLISVPNTGHLRAAIAGIGHRHGEAISGLDGDDEGDDVWARTTSEIIRMAQTYIELERHLQSGQAAVDQMRRMGGFKSEYLTALVAIERVQQVQIVAREIELSELSAGMVAAQDIKTNRGALLVARGQTLSANVLSRLAAMPPHLIVQPIFIESAVAAEIEAA